MSNLCTAHGLASIRCETRPPVLDARLRLNERSIEVLGVAPRRLVGREGNPSQFSWIEPVHLTSFARVDDHVSRTVVDVSEHRLSAQRTGDDAVTGILVTSSDRLNRPVFAGAHGINHVSEAVHRNQHAETPCTAEQRISVESTRRKRRGAERAEARCRALEVDIVEGRRQLLLIAAMITDEDPPFTVHPQRGAAVDAVSHQAKTPDTSQHNAYAMSPSISISYTWNPRRPAPSNT